MEIPSKPKPLAVVTRRLYVESRYPDRHGRITIHGRDYYLSQYDFVSPVRVWIDADTLEAKTITDSQRNSISFRSVQLGSAI